jgi:probable HAF family extracellular repeat protein
MGATATHAVLWTKGIMTDLGTLGGEFSFGVAINPAGQVVGTSETVAGAQHAFLWTKGVMVDLGTLGGTNSGVADINPAGEIVGSSETEIGIPLRHAVVWTRK